MRGKIIGVTNEDSAGIFVENQGIVQSDTFLIETKPIIITDSAALKWLENTELSGTVEQEQKYIVIKIYNN